MVALTSSGTQTATVTTEHTLATVTTSGIFQLFVDASALANGDELELRAKYKVLSGGTTRECLIGSYKHAIGQPIVFSEALVSDQEIVFTLKQTVGTGRSFPWKVLQADG